MTENNPAPRYTRGEVVFNRLTGRQATILNSARLGTTYAYEILEKGFVYPEGCSRTPGAGTMPEFVLEPTDETAFNDLELSILLLAYSA